MLLFRDVHRFDVNNFDTILHERTAVGGSTFGCPHYEHGTHVATLIDFVGGKAVGLQVSVCPKLF